MFDIFYIEIIICRWCVWVWLYCYITITSTPYSYLFFLFLFWISRVQWSNKRIKKINNNNDNWNHHHHHHYWHYQDQCFFGLFSLSLSSNSLLFIEWLLLFCISESLCCFLFDVVWLFSLVSDDDCRVCVCVWYMCIWISRMATKTEISNSFVSIDFYLMNVYLSLPLQPKKKDVMTLSKAEKHLHLAFNFFFHFFFFF